MIEGHVPSAEVKKLLKAGHNIDGLAVPGMPAGSPGMDMGPRKDAYKAIAFKGIKAAEFASY